jgi:sugar phosphate isomerase/epimerase
MKRLSICENTTPGWSFEQDVKNYKNASINAISIGYDKIRDMEIETVENILKASRMKVSSLLLTGFFTLRDQERKEKKSCIIDPVKAIELAHRLNADYLLVLSGPPCMKNGGIKEAERITKISLQNLAPIAKTLNVRLGLEILHPMYLDSWSAISTIDQAMNIIESIDSENIGLVLDLYHIFWDPKLSEGIKRASGKIFGVHIDDWRCPTRDILRDRVVMGDGIIPIGQIIKDIQDTGYRGFFEVEIISNKIPPPDYFSLLETIGQSYVETIGAVLQNEI